MILYLELLGAGPVKKNTLYYKLTPGYVTLGKCKKTKASPGDQKSQKDEKAEDISARPPSLDHRTIRIAAQR